MAKIGGSFRNSAEIVQKTEALKNAGFIDAKQQEEILKNLGVSHPEKKDQGDSRQVSGMSFDAE